MKTIFILFLLIFTTFSFAGKTLQCERYSVTEDKSIKTERMVFTLVLSKNPKSIKYNHISGYKLFTPSKSVLLNHLWTSKNGLRVVATWVNPKYEVVNTENHPVYLLDIDFQRPRFNLKTFGGFSDFNTTLNKSWKQECMRTD